MTLEMLLRQAFCAAPTIDRLHTEAAAGALLLTTICTLVHQRAAEGCLAAVSNSPRALRSLLLDTIYRATCTAGFCKAAFIQTHAVPPQCNWLNVNACANYQQNGGMKGLNGFGGALAW